MLRITSISNGSAAAAYYGGGNADYYLGEQEPAQWHGLAANKLGLHGEVQDADFKRLMNNRAPDGSKLTARDNPRRRGGYDFTFSVPKSVTIMDAIAGDPRIRQSVKAAVAATMQEVELDARVRVRKGGANADRVTGNMVWADFMHDTTRPIGGVPDPHLHVHAVVANATWDSKEGKFKAIEISNIKANADYYQAFFRQTLAEQLKSHGYQLESHGKDFEIRGVPLEARAAFSRRTNQIEALNKRLASERGFDSLSPETKAKLGATSREAKTKGLTRTDLKEIWSHSLNPHDHKQILDTFHSSMFAKPERVDRSHEFVDKAMASTKTTFVSEKRLYAKAAYMDVTESSPAGIKQAIQGKVHRGQFLRRVHKDDEYLTTRSKMLDEIKLIDLWKQRGKWDGRHRQTVKGVKKSKVFEKLLGSRDRVKSFRGLLSTKQRGVMGEVTEGLPDAQLLDQPSVQEALELAIFDNDSEVIIYDQLRKDEPRQGAADTLQDFLGVQPFTFSERKVPEAIHRVSQRLKDAVSFTIRSFTHEREHTRVPDRERADG